MTNTAPADSARQKHGTPCRPAGRLRPFILAVLAAGFMTAPLPVSALDSSEMFADPAKEARAREIGRELRCLVCQNQSIFDSNAELARDLRVVVRERMEAGDSDAEVLEYVRARFGDYVLLEPPVSGQTALLWLAPLGFVLLGAAAMRGYLRKRPRPGAADAGLSDSERAEARRLLGDSKS